MRRRLWGRGGRDIGQPPIGEYTQANIGPEEVLARQSFTGYPVVPSHTGWLPSEPTCPTLRNGEVSMSRRSTRHDNLQDSENEEPFAPSDLRIRVVNYGLLSLLVIGLAFALRGYFRSDDEAAGMKSWATTEGTMINSSISEKTTWHRKTGKRTERNLMVTYTYQVNGVAYNGSRYGLDSLSGGESGAQAELAKHAPGNIVPVFYNPASPGESILNRAPPSTFWFWIIFAVLGYLIVSVFRMIITDEAVMGRKNSKKGRSKKESNWKSTRENPDYPMPPITRPRKPRPLS